MIILGLILLIIGLIAKIAILWTIGIVVYLILIPAAGRRMLAAGWPDQDSIDGGLIDPVDPMFVTKLFEGVE